MKFENCLLSVDRRDGDGSFTHGGGTFGLDQSWTDFNGENISVKLDAGIEASVTLHLTNAAAREFASTLLRFLDASSANHVLNHHTIRN